MNRNDKAGRFAKKEHKKVRKSSRGRAQQMARLKDMEIPKRGALRKLFERLFGAAK
jgi:hypothetical protein